MKKICYHLNFDKTYSLSGYPIKIVEIPFFYNPSMKGLSKLYMVFGKLLSEIWTPLHPSIDVSVVPDDFNINENGTEIGSSLFGILNGTFDMRAALEHQRLFGFFWKSEVNMFIRSGICYATSNKRMSLNEYFEHKIYLVMFVMAMCILLMTEKIIMYLSKQNHIEIVMDLLRATVGVATLWEPKKSFKRIIFLIIIFPFIIVSSYIQGELTSFVTVTPYKEINIEKSEDLLNQNIELFTSDYHRQFFLSTSLYNHIKTWKSEEECYDSLKFNVSKACANDCSFMKKKNYDRDYVKISPDIYLQRYFAYVFPIDYPLLYRIRKIYYNIHEAGIMQRILDSEKKNIQKVSTASSLTLDEIKPLFDFLIYTYISAISLFFIEAISSNLLKLFCSTFMKNFFTIIACNSNRLKIKFQRFFPVNKKSNCKE